ncbi:phenylacetate-CoA ligase [Stella humosa]|uniref:Phenylacetate-CoA ligase n=1 Tax=Stella humosa TaxID=94 RepID=A0A3N1LCN6_9PROT|nr:AMP-binding protein [Stella humosa]ROP90801.1 phenylacetate-CoA ligase [Stella humosa]BBK34853.1 CoA ligase [Stella humosa]
MTIENDSATPWSPTQWSKAESWSRDCLAAFQKKALATQLAYVEANSAFYRARFAAAGFRAADFREPADLARLPLTTKQDYMAALDDGPPWGSALACDPAAVRRLHFSSGTTSRPTPDAWTGPDLARWADLYGRAAYSQGVRRGDVFQCLFSYPWFVGGLGATAAFERIGCMVIPGGSGDTERQIETLFAYGTTTIMATPSFAAHLAEVAQRMGRDLRQSKVRHIGVGGEPGAGVPATRARLEALWDAKVFDCYGSLEFQPIAWDCAAQAGGHLVEDFAHVEVIDPATGAAVPDGTPGMLVLTHLDKQAFPLVRWATGDIVVRDSRPCACGRTHARLPGGVRGRADDMIVIRGVNLFPTAVEDVVRAMPGLADEYRIILDETVRDPATGFPTGIRLQVEAAADAPADIGHRLADAIRTKLLVRATVEVLAPMALERFTHKAKRLVRQ